MNKLPVNPFSTELISGFGFSYVEIQVLVTATTMALVKNSPPSDRFVPQSAEVAEDFLLKEGIRFASAESSI